ncbi:alpha/beta hydrolase [Marinilactibacillus piezotolerans]|uniref:alpha/beta hydrolase n=1 Tax=Marinilactibacillus piezotolerans TaxID=258723 RepID=UPI0009AF98A7|nr:alpha/beta hydrolase [Marinilactibacillus piezotolerans]
MRYFKNTIGKNNAEITFYLHEPSDEIDKNRKYPVMVVVPGGGYMWTSDREAEPIALEFFAKDYHVAVVRYCTEGLEAYQSKADLPKEPVSQFPNPLLELAETLSLLRENKEKWFIEEDKISVLGFSAGGNLVGLLGVYWNENWLEKLVGRKKASYQPNHIIIAYGALDLTNSQDEESLISLAITGKLKAGKDDLMRVSPVYHVNKYTPPAFIWHTGEDPLVEAADSLKFAMAMDEKDRPYELHIYEKGVHGVALADSRTSRKENQSNKQASTWVNLLIGWLNAQQ